MSYLINSDGTWVEPKQIFVNNDGNWTPVKSVYVTTATGWTKVFPASSSTVYSTPGYYTFTVPNGIYSLNVSYPTTSTVANSTIAVTPGQKLIVNIGNVGSGSSVGSLQLPKYEHEVFDILTTVNDSLIVQLGVTTTSSNTVISFTGSSGTPGMYGILGQLLNLTQSDDDNTALMAAAAAAGFYLVLAYDSLGGRKAYNSTVSLGAVPQSTVLYDLNLYVEFVQGPSQGCSVLQHPSAANNYVGGFIFSDPAADPHQCNGKLILQQVVGVSINW